MTVCPGVSMRVNPLWILISASGDESCTSGKFKGFF